MSLLPDYCPLCLAENVVATIYGPTCKHQPKHGLAWWPENWQTMTEYERVEWLKKLTPRLQASPPSSVGPESGR